MEEGEKSHPSQMPAVTLTNDRFLSEPVEARKVTHLSIAIFLTYRFVS